MKKKFGTSEGTYEFTITMAAYGTNVADAWTNAVCAMPKTLVPFQVRTKQNFSARRNK